MVQLDGLARFRGPGPHTGSASAGRDATASEGHHGGLPGSTGTQARIGSLQVGKINIQDFHLLCITGKRPSPGPTTIGSRNTIRAAQLSSNAADIFPAYDLVGPEKIAKRHAPDVDETGKWKQQKNRHPEKQVYLEDRVHTCK